MNFPKQVIVWRQTFVVLCWREEITLRIKVQFTRHIKLARPHVQSLLLNVWLCVKSSTAFAKTSLISFKSPGKLDKPVFYHAGTDQTPPWGLLVTEKWLLWTLVTANYTFLCMSWLFATHWDVLILQCNPCTLYVSVQNVFPCSLSLSLWCVQNFHAFTEKEKERKVICIYLNLSFKIASHVCLLWLS